MKEWCDEEEEETESEFEHKLEVVHVFNDETIWKQQETSNILK